MRRPVTREDLTDPYTLPGAASAFLLALLAIGFAVGVAVNALGHLVPAGRPERPAIQRADQ
jgi:hypothetical protein